MKIYNYLFLTVIAMIFALPVGAQETTSPYSKFGYGLLNDNATSSQRAMGGVGYAMQNGRQINVMNPASYAAIDSLTMLWDFGLDFSALQSKEDGKTGNSFGGGLDYLTMQFPIGKIMGGSFGLVPYSSVGYSYGTEINNGSDSRVGHGGLNQLYGGFSIRPFKGFSVGTNISYMFGTTIDDAYATSNTVSASSTTLYESVMKVRTWNAQFGVQYNFNVNKKHSFTLGAVYTPKKSLHGHAWGIKYDVTSGEAPDTLGYTSMKGKYYTPNSYGFGLSYTYDKKLTVEADFTYQEWSKAKFPALENFDKENVNFNNRWKVATGLQYTPDARGGYFKRINYRLGGYYNNDYISVKTNDVREYGVSMGFGLPTPSSKTVINLGFEYKHRYTKPVNLIAENYFNVTIGVNFNELWFWQNKIR